MCLDYTNASSALSGGANSTSPDVPLLNGSSLSTTNATPGSLCPANASRCDVDFRTGQTLVVSLYGAIFVLGLTTNGLTLRPLVGQMRRGNVLAVYLLNLLFSDLLYLSTLPLWMLYVFHGHRWTLGGVACHVAGFVFYSNMYVSIFLLCANSVERYRAVVQPFGSWGQPSQTSAAVASTSVALLVFLLHLAVDPSCYDSYPLQPGVAKFNYFRVATGFAFPLLILAVSYLKIVRMVRGSEALLAWKKAKVRSLSLGISAIFLLCFAPYHLLLLVRSLAATFLDCCSICALEQLLQLPFSLSLAASSLNSALDPVLYALASDTVKQGVKKALGF
ncbi:probable G-protein coupled receptor 132 [Lacerta agilis]|uniref:probable G-protein coupled receptor 132 n=1 Tax=Lacerta agilis TaxID=80427 RepID=UPI0014192631|nr:probable G-protein coupled receptor 132 [Lacerta agilis]